jgi:hypothetical protein
MNQGMKQYAPETAVGTGAATPLVDPVAAAAKVPSIDQSTVGSGGANGKNKPRANENSDIKPSGDELAEPTDDRNSTGEDEETRENANAHKDDADVNKEASTVRPTEPQALSKHARPASAVQKPQLP